LKELRCVIPLEWGDERTRSVCPKCMTEQTMEGPCVCNKGCVRTFLIDIFMDNKTLLTGGIATLALILGMTSFALKKTPQAENIPTAAQNTEVLGDESLVESEDAMQMETANLKQYESAPEMQLTDGVNYKARMQTSAGEVLIDLFQDEAPITVNNFIFLAKEGFYDGVIFHRIIPQFMIQGGDPLGMGVGGPGYSFEDEINEMKLVEGSLAMANSGPNTNGSQFFIVTLVETPWLDGLHTNFGQVIEGLDVVHQIESVPTGANDKPVTDVVILSVEIIEE